MIEYKEETSRRMANAYVTGTNDCVIALIRMRRAVSFLKSRTILKTLMRRKMFKPGISTLGITPKIEMTITMASKTDHPSFTNWVYHDPNRLKSNSSVNTAVKNISTGTNSEKSAHWLYIVDILGMRALNFCLC
jgi:hypothetical protein